MTETLRYKVDGMSCDHCRVAIASGVSRLAGVESVEVDLQSKLVQVSGEDVDGDAVLAAIDDAGYDAERA